MIEQVPEWADRRCNCGAYLGDDEPTFSLGDGEEVCEGCFDAIASVDNPGPGGPNDDA